MGGDNPSEFKDALTNPVERVIWTDIVETFLPRLNARVLGLAARLPTEVAWEYACRGDMAEKSPFWFGDWLSSDQANFDGTFPMPGREQSEFRGRTVPVKALPCNGWGLYQMHGNVWEWCADRHAPYPRENPHENRELVVSVLSSELPSKSLNRMLRGGSWLSVESDSRSGQRFASAPDRQRSDIGFRLACEGF